MSLVENELKNTKYYKKLDKPIIKETIKKIKHLLTNLKNIKEITNNEYKTLTKNINDKNAGVLYGIPKLHKQELTIRPIISNINHPTEQISTYLHNIMKTTAKASLTHLENSQALIDTLQNITPDQNMYIITADIESLYTNIPNDLGEKTVTFETYLNPNRCYKKPKNPLTFQALLHNTLVNNIFDHNGNHYIQVNGTAMGTVMAPTYANIFLKHLEETRLLNNPNLEHLTKNIKCFKRYVDDFFLLYLNKNNTLPELIKTLKETYSPLTLKIKINKNANFLDLEIKINTFMNRFDIKLYKKPIGNQQLLDPNSNHPPHIIKNIIKQEINRIEKNCNNEIDEQKEKNKIINKARTQKYPNKYIKHALNKKPKKAKKEFLKKDIIKISYNQNYKQISQIIKQTTNKNINIITKTLPSLRDILVRARLPKP